jgi:membrane peptidoglycan carboxypeptidase
LPYRNPTHRRLPPQGLKPLFPRKAETSETPRRAGKPYKMRVPQALWLAPIVILFGFGGVVGSFAKKEMDTSRLQATYLTQIASKIRFELEPGPAPRFRVPSAGPYNQRLGYSYVPFFEKALSGDNYVITQQTRTSDDFRFLVQKGIYPIYHAKTTAGLSLTDRSGAPMYSVSYPSHVFPSFDALPPLLVNTLLFIENRELLQAGPPTRNPVIEWDRFFYALFGRALQIFVPGFNAGGGSTLATQIEKFRYSPGGQTGSAMEKLRQIASASLRVYQDGPDTRDARKKIVLDYLNSTPLSARAGFGEINSIGDGLWAWFGMDLPTLTTALNLPEDEGEALRAKAAAYRMALGLILAQRRPTAYLLTNRPALDELTDVTLDKLANAGVISRALRDATRATRFHFLPEPPSAPPLSYLDQKATTALRTHLLGMLGLKNLYELDRLDVAATGTLDLAVQKKVTDFLKQMGDKDFVRSIGMFGFRLLNPQNDPSKIKWSVVLYERGDNGNRLRVQADNIDGPFDMNEGVKLDLGSTAKLRTLITYLEIVGELHRRYAGLSRDDLLDMVEDTPDPLTEWAVTWLSDHTQASLQDMLDAALMRKYSGSPGETFFTGGGAHHFVNFEKSEDYRIMNLHEAFRDSVNLVFIRLMRDIVNYTIGQGAQTKEEILGDKNNPARRAYLERYADREGSVFLNRYISEYARLTPRDILEKATSHARKGATARTVLFRSLRPKAGYADYAAYMTAHMTEAFDTDRLPKLYHDYPIERFNLADRGYVTGLNPLELWLASALIENPEANRQSLLAASKQVRIDSYAWLFRPRKTGAQNTRIRILLEADAFARIQQRWARLGYPFDRLVPSLATAIGSSADRPGALAELIGILLNDGIRKPMLRFEKLHFAAATPYETILTPGGNAGVQVLDPAIARTVRQVMTEVIENGTAKRLRGAYVDAEGKPLPIGGKTGTGDHRFDSFGAGGRLISSRVVNRTGTIVFYIGDNFFGTVTAHVAGEDAANYKFTSALSAQMLRSLAPVLQPLITPGSMPAAPIKPIKMETPEPGEGNATDDEDQDTDKHATPEEDLPEPEEE